MTHSSNKNRTPGSQYARNDNNGVIARPAEVPQSEAVSASPQGHHTPLQPTDPPLSQISFEYKGKSILILHEIDEGEQPQRIEDVIKRWQAVPKSMRFDVLGLKRHFFCFDKQTGEIDYDMELPDKCAQKAQKEQDERIRDFMAKLTGEKPAAPAAGTLTVELINATSKDDLFDVFYNMSKDDRERVINTAVAASKKRYRESQERRQKITGGKDDHNGSDHKGAQAPQQPKQQPAQPVRPAQPVQPTQPTQPTPAPQTTTGLGARRRRRGG